MKRVYKIIIAILIALIFTTEPKAEPYGDLEVKWSFDSSSFESIEKDDDSYIIYTKNSIIKVFKNKQENKILNFNNYYTVKIDGDNKIVFAKDDKATKILRIDKNLKILTENNVDISSIQFYEKKNNKYVLFGKDPEDTNTLIRLELNENFNTTKKESFTFSKSLHGYKYTTDGNYYFMTSGSSPFYYVKYNNGFSEISNSEIPSNTSSMNFNSDIYYLSNYEEAYDGIIESGEIYNQIEAKNPIDEPDTAFVLKDTPNYIALFSQNHYDSIGSGNDKKISIPDAYLKYYDQNLKEKWSIKIDGETIDNNGFCIYKKAMVNIAKYQDDIILAYNRSNIQSLKLYSKDGKVKKDLSSLVISNPDFTPSYIGKLGNGFIIIYDKHYVQCNAANKNTSSPKATLLYTIDESSQGSIVYFIDYKYTIDTKITGKGKINVQKAANEDDLVKFIITPEKGYVLSVVKVTDADGNVVYFKDYTFTMPSANVTIEATFVKDTNASESAEKPEEKNPKTGAYISYVIFSTAILIGIGIIALEKNHKNKIWKI